MARSFSLSILFCLLFTAMCHHGNGARNVMHNAEEIKTVPELDLKNPSPESSLDKTKKGLQGKGEVREQYLRDLFSSVLLWNDNNVKEVDNLQGKGKVPEQYIRDLFSSLLLWNDDNVKKIDELQGKGEVPEQYIRDLFSSLLLWNDDNVKKIDELQGKGEVPRQYIRDLFSSLLLWNDDNVKKIDDLQGKGEVPGQYIRDLFSSVFFGNDDNVSHLKDLLSFNEPRPSSGHKVLNVSNAGLFAFNEFQVGKIFPIHFPTNGASPHFLPKSVADSIPFKSSELQNILRILSIPRDSYLAERMEATLRVCERKPLEGETKTCATSLGSLLEYLQVAFGAGTKFEVLTTIGPKMASSALLNYKVLDAPKEIGTPNNVVCYPMSYAYEVFYCHYFASKRKAYKVTLGVENGEKVESIAVCHMDTSAWKADSYAFDLLGVKHGDPVCHFIPPGHFVWVQSPIKQSAI